MTSEADLEPTHNPESPASPQWDICSASDSENFSDSDSDHSDAGSNRISAEWTATMPVGDKMNPQAAVFTEDQDAFLRNLLEDGYLNRFDSTNSILIACLQTMHRSFLVAQEEQRQDTKLLREQFNNERLAREKVSQELDSERLARGNLSQELQIAQSKLNLVDAMRSDVKLLRDGLEKATLESEELLQKLQVAQQEIELAKTERAKLSWDLRTAQEEIETAEEELGEKEEQVVTIQNLLVDVETAHIELEKSVVTKFNNLQMKLDSMQANLQSKEELVHECSKLRIDVNALQSQIVAIHDGLQSRKQNDNKRITGILSRVDDHERQIATLNRCDWQHTQAYHELKDFKVIAEGKLPEIDKLRMEFDANSEGIQSQERTSVKLFKTLQTRIDEQDQVLRRIQKKSASYASNDSLSRLSNLLSTRIDDCTVEMGQTSRSLQKSFDSKIASSERELKELDMKLESLSAASVSNLHEWIDAVNEHLGAVDKQVQAVDQRVNVESHRIVHVGQHVGVVERQIGDLRSQTIKLQEENTKLLGIVEQQASMLKQISSHMMPELANFGVSSKQTNLTESSSSSILTESDTPALILDCRWTVAEVEQEPSNFLFNGRVVKPEGYEDLLIRLPDTIKLIFNLADAGIDPRPTINSLSANHENIWAGIPSEHRRLVGLVCLKYMASDTKLDDDRKHLKWIAETLTAEDWAEYECLVNHLVSFSWREESDFQGQEEEAVPFPYAFKCFKTTDNERQEPLAKTEFKLSKVEIERLKAWLDASKVWSETSRKNGNGGIPLPLWNQDLLTWEQLFQTPSENRRRHRLVHSRLGLSEVVERERKILPMLAWTR